MAKKKYQPKITAEEYEELTGQRIGSLIGGNESNVENVENVRNKSVSRTYDGDNGVSNIVQEGGERTISNAR